ncbi:hypothetical protein [Clostridium perfringens]|uniref:hypothetical protein n=1 Tax=Clostridium perfringens TaxID=1502 RepID=UPI0039E9B137
MSNFELHPYKKDGSTFRSKPSFLSNEYITKHCNFYLQDHLQRNEDGSITTYYQLKTKQIKHINTTMAYNIECPKCRAYLKVCQLGSDGNTHSWYICPKCTNRRNKS